VKNSKSSEEKLFTERNFDGEAGLSQNATKVSHLSAVDPDTSLPRYLKTALIYILRKTDLSVSLLLYHFNVYETERHEG